MFSTPSTSILLQTRSSRAVFPVMTVAISRNAAMPAIDNDDWLSHFEQRLEGLRLLPIFWFSNLLMVIGFVSLLWSLPTPDEFYAISPLLNWGSALLMVTAVYYFIISLPLAIGMLPLLLAVAAIEVGISSSTLPAQAISVATISLAIVGLGITRRSTSAVVSDLLLTMLAPVFLLSLIYRKYGIPI